MKGQAGEGHVIAQALWLQLNPDINQKSFCEDNELKSEVISNVNYEVIMHLIL